MLSWQNLGDLRVKKAKLIWYVLVWISEALVKIKPIIWLIYVPQTAPVHSGGKRSSFRWKWDVSVKNHNSHEQFAVPANCCSVECFPTVSSTSRFRTQNDSHPLAEKSEKLLWWQSGKCSRLLLEPIWE